MQRYEARTAWGLLLIAVGLLFLLQSVGIIPTGIGLVWAALFAMGGVTFLYFFLNDQERNWWAVIPAFTLLGLAAVTTVGELSPRNADLGGMLFLGAIGLSFVVVYANNRRFWWAIIPAGTLLTLALVAGVEVSTFGGEEEGGGIFFIGLGLTFLALYFAPVPNRRQTRWAIIPAVALLVMGVLITAALTNLIAYVGPLVLIGLGLWLFLRGTRSRAQS
ncbi:MAG: hypothetical protein ACYC4L_21915 [Chloroflexota bacterium]